MTLDLRSNPSLHEDRSSHASTWFPDASSFGDDEHTPIDLEEEEFQERMDMWAERYNPAVFVKKYMAHCCRCGMPFPRTTPVHSSCLSCMVQCVESKLEPLLFKVFAKELGANIMAFLLCSTKSRFRDQRKYILRTVLCQRFSPFHRMEGNERPFLNESEYEWVYHRQSMTDYWNPPTVLDYMLKFI